MQRKLYYTLFLAMIYLTTVAQEKTSVQLHCSELLADYTGSGTIDFFDIFPNTPISSTDLKGNILTIKSVKTTLGNIKSAEIIFAQPMPDSNYVIIFSGNTKRTHTNNTLDINFSTEKSVKYFISHKSIRSFVLTAEEIYPAPQDSKVEFNFIFHKNEKYEMPPSYSAVFLHN